MKERQKLRVRIWKKRHSCIAFQEINQDFESQ